MPSVVLKPLIERFSFNVGQQPNSLFKCQREFIWRLHSFVQITDANMLSSNINSPTRFGQLDPIFEICAAMYEILREKPNLSKSRAEINAPFIFNVSAA